MSGCHNPEVKEKELREKVKQILAKWEEYFDTNKKNKASAQDNDDGTCSLIGRGE